MTKTIVIDRIDEVPEPILVDLSTERYNCFLRITNREKCCAKDLSIVRLAVEQYNSGIRDSAALSVVNEALRNLRACGYKIRIVDEDT